MLGPFTTLYTARPKASRSVLVVVRVAQSLGEYAADTPRYAALHDDPLWAFDPERMPQLRFGYNKP